MNIPETEHDTPETITETTSTDIQPPSTPVKNPRPKKWTEPKLKEAIVKFKNDNNLTYSDIVTEISKHVKEEEPIKPPTLRAWLKTPGRHSTICFEICTLFLQNSKVYLKKNSLLPATIEANKTNSKSSTPKKSTSTTLAPDSGRDTPNKSPKSPVSTSTLTPDVDQDILGHQKDDYDHARPTMRFCSWNIQTFGKSRSDNTGTGQSGNPDIFATLEQENLSLIARIANYQKKIWDIENSIAIKTAQIKKVNRELERKESIIQSLVQDLPTRQAQRKYSSSTTSSSTNSNNRSGTGASTASAAATPVLTRSSSTVSTWWGTSTKQLQNSYQKLQAVFEEQVLKNIELRSELENLRGKLTHVNGNINGKVNASADSKN